MSETQTTASSDENRDTAERRDERAKWTKDLAEIFRGFTADPNYAAYVYVANFLDPVPSDAMVVVHSITEANAEICS